MISLPLSVSCIALASLILYYAIYPVFISPLRKIPSAHWSTPFHPGWLLWVRKNDREGTTLIDCHRRLGPIVRTGPDEISISRIEDVRCVYHGNFEKEAWLAKSADNYGIKNMFSMGSHRDHGERRRSIWQAYCKTRILCSQELVDIAKRMTYSRLGPLLQEAAGSNKSINIVNLNSSWAMDFITAYLFGLDNCSNFLQQPSSHQKFFNFYLTRCKHAFWPTQFPRLCSFLTKVHLLSLKAHKHAIEGIENWCMDFCIRAELKANTTGSSSFSVYHYLQKRLEGRVNEFRNSKEEVLTSPISLLSPAALEKKDFSKFAVPSPPLTMASEMLDHLAVGQETAGSSLSYAMLQLSLNPTVQAKLRKELQGVMPLSTFESVHRLPSLKALEQLPYLQAVMLEALRLNNHKAGHQRITPSTGCVLAGYQIPPRTRVSAMVHVVHRNEDVYENAEIFRPERWIEADVVQQRRMCNQFWAFGSGDRGCVASHFATQLLKVILAYMYSNYSTEVHSHNAASTPNGRFKAGSEANSVHLRFEKADASTFADKKDQPPRRVVDSIGRDCSVSYYDRSAEATRA